MFLLEKWKKIDGSSTCSLRGTYAGVPQLPLNFLNIERTQDCLYYPVCRAGGMWTSSHAQSFYFFTFFQIFFERSSNYVMQR